MPQLNYILQSFYNQTKKQISQTNNEMDVFVLNKTIHKYTYTNNIIITTKIYKQIFKLITKSIIYKCLIHNILQVIQIVSTVTK